MKQTNICFLVFLFISVLVVSCAPYDPSEDKEVVERIIPGIGINKVSIGDSGKKVVEVYGEPDTMVVEGLYAYLF